MVDFIFLMPHFVINNLICKSIIQGPSQWILVLKCGHVVQGQGKVTIFRTLSNDLKHTGAACHHIMCSGDAVKFAVCKRLMAAGHDPV